MTPLASAGYAKQRVARLSIASNTTLTILKLATWVLTGSVSVLSEAVHSGIDLIAAVMAFLAVRSSSRPADADHQFGHGKFESLSGLAEGALILVAVVMIAWSALHRLIFHHAEVTYAVVGVVVMGLSAVINVFVSRKLFRVARQTDSVALEADAWHLRTDVWTSLGVVGALAAITVAGYAGMHGAAILDPLAALAIAAIITRAAIDIMRRSWGHVVDRSLPPDEVAMIESLLTEHYPELSSYHRLRTRKAGAERYIDLHVVVSGDQSVSDAHVLCDHLEADLLRALPRAEVLIHVEPRGRDGR